MKKEIEVLKNEIAIRKEDAQLVENEYEKALDEIDTLQTEIERKNEAIIKAKLIIEKYNRWTGQTTIQDHVPDHAAKIVFQWLEKALKDDYK